VDARRGRVGARWPTRLQARTHGAGSYLVNRLLFERECGRVMAHRAPQAHCVFVSGRRLLTVWTSSFASILYLTFKCSGPQGNRRCRPTAASFATRSAAPSADKPCVGCRLRCVRQRRSGGTVTPEVPTNVAASASRRCRWQCPPRTGTGFSPSHGGTLACAAAHSQTEATAGAPRACAHARTASSSSLSVSCQLRP